MTFPKAFPKAFPTMFDLSGKVSIVTGGNRGIGRGLALGLAEAGAAVAILARDEDKSRSTLKELQALGVPAMALQVDLKQRRELRPAFDEVERRRTLDRGAPRRNRQGSKSRWDLERRNSTRNRCATGAPSIYAARRSPT